MQENLLSSLEMTVFPLSSNDSNSPQDPYFTGIFIVEPENPNLIPDPPTDGPVMTAQEEINLMLAESAEKAGNITNIDSDESNSDWVKGLSWDLPRTAKDFINTIGGPDKWEHFQTLPAFLAMPEELKTEVESYLKDEKVAE
jgi:hypothetical protein